MSNRDQIEAREKERQIKQFNETLKNTPELLNDEFFLFQNIYNCRLKLKQLPAKHLDNVLLMTEYFKSNRDFINYKYIKKDILNNPLFLTQTMSSNPDLYFFISDENKAIFKPLAISSEKEYLKYLSDSDYDNANILKNISHRFNYFNESLSCISIDNFQKLINNPHGKYVIEALPSLNFAQCQLLKNPLNAYLEENKQKNGFGWLNTILNQNPYLYTILDKEKYKDEKSKTLLISLAGKYHDLFTHLPQEWKKDLEVIVKVMTDNTDISYSYQKFGNKYHQMVRNAALVLNEYTTPEEFIKEKLNDELMTHLRKAYPQLTIEWRNKDSIIKSLFRERDDFVIDLEYCRSIPDANLAEKLANHLKNFKTRELEYVGNDLESITNHHYLNENLTVKDGNEKKPKI